MRGLSRDIIITLTKKGEIIKFKASPSLNDSIRFNKYLNKEFINMVLYRMLIFNITFFFII